jgi:hypothetical protein
MREGQDMKRLREVAISLLGSEKGALFSNLVSQLNLVGSVSPNVDCPKPAWAADLSDQRQLLRWDTSQYVGSIGINGKLVYCIVDTGAHRTIIDTKMATALGLKIRKDVTCGKYSVPGSEAVHAYAGIVEGDTDLQISRDIRTRVRNLRVIDHPHPFLLLGADVLSGGRKSGQWNFSGIQVKTLAEGSVEAELNFEISGKTVHVALVHAPVGSSVDTRVPGADEFLAAVSPPLVGGQCLRHNF